MNGFIAAGITNSFDEAVQASLKCNAEEYCSNESDFSSDDDSEDGDTQFSD